MQKLVIPRKTVYRLSLYYRALQRLKGSNIETVSSAALAKAAALRGAPPPRRRVLAIGDSVRTDLKGAVSFGVDCLFVISGLHAEEAGGREGPDLSALNAMFAAAGVAPKAVTARLAW